MGDEIIPHRYFCVSCGKITEPFEKKAFGDKLCGRDECYKVFLIREKERYMESRDWSRNFSNKQCLYVSSYHPRNLSFALVVEVMYKTHLDGRTIKLEFNDTTDLFNELNVSSFKDRLHLGCIKKYLVDQGFAEVVHPTYYKKINIDEYKRINYLMDTDKLIHLERTLLEQYGNFELVLDYSNRDVKIIPTKKLLNAQAKIHLWHTIKSFFTKEQ